MNQTSFAYDDTTFKQHSDSSSYEDVKNKIKYFTKLFNLYKIILLKYLTNPAKHPLRTLEAGIQISDDIFFSILTRVLNSLRIKH